MVTSKHTVLKKGKCVRNASVVFVISVRRTNPKEFTVCGVIWIRVYIGIRWERVGCIIGDANAFFRPERNVACWRKWVRIDVGNIGFGMETFKKKRGFFFDVISYVGKHTKYYYFYLFFRPEIHKHVTGSSIKTGGLVGLFDVDADAIRRRCCGNFFVHESVSGIVFVVRAVSEIGKRFFNRRFIFYEKFNAEF